MISWTPPRPDRWLLFLILLPLLVACNTQRYRSDLLNDSWSRGLSIGAGNLREPAALLLDPGGEALHVVRGKRGDNGIDIHYALVDRDRGVLISEQLDAGLFLPRDLHLFLSPTGDLHILTRARPGSEGVDGLYHLALTPEGKLDALPQLLTPINQIVENFDAAQLNDGRVAVVWEAAHETGGGLYAGLLDIDKRVVAPATYIPIVENGQGPSLAWDEVENRLYLLWYDASELGERAIHYASYDGGELMPDEGMIVHEFGTSDRITYSAPVMGFDDGHIYAFWSREIMGGLGVGTAETRYIAFAKTVPAETPSRSVQIPLVPPESGVQHESHLTYTPASRNLGGLRSSYVIFPSPVNGHSGELPLFVSSQSSYRMQEEVQPVMAVFADGDQVGYEYIGRSDHTSYFPVGVRDGEGWLYAVWLDLMVGGNYEVLVSSTAPAWRSGILQTTSQDVAGDVAGELSFGLLATVALVPVVLIILALPFVWLVILLLLGKAEELNTRAGRIQFLIAVAVYLVTKTLAFAPLLASPALLRSAPPAYTGLFTLLLPLAILVLSGAAFWLYTRRADHPGLILGFFIFSVTDVLLSTVIYGPALYT